MTTYCFKCPTCDRRVEQGVRDPAPTCKHDPATTGWETEWDIMVRDWKAESIMIDKTAFREHADGTPANPGGIRKKLVSGNVPDPW